MQRAAHRCSLLSDQKSHPTQLQLNNDDFFICPCLFATSAAPGAIIHRMTNLRFGSATGGPFGNSSAVIDVNQDGIVDWNVGTTVSSMNVGSSCGADSTRFVFRLQLAISGNEPAPLEEMTHISLSLENPGLQFLTSSDVTQRSLVFTSNNDESM